MCCGLPQSGRNFDAVVYIIRFIVGGQRLARLSDAVDRVVHCLADLPGASQTDVPSIIWPGVSQYGQKLVGLPPAVLSAQWCGEIEISWLVGW